MAEGSKRKKKRAGLKRVLPLYLMMVPAFLYLLINNYLPMSGLVLAFKKYNVQDGIWGSDWAGMSNFTFLLKNRELPILFRNTLGYNICFILVNLVLGVTLAILITEIRCPRFRKLAQSSVLFPFVVSIIIVSYMVRGFLDPEAGLLNHLLQSFGGKRISWYDREQYWPFILIFVNTWKSVGYGCILYISAIMGIDMSLYESASLDGAGKFQKIRYITLPFLKPTMITVVLLAVGRIFNRGPVRDQPLAGAPARYQRSPGRMAEIRLENVTKRYIEEKRPHYAVREISLSVEQGEFIFLIGSSGAGKSTLLKLIGGEMAPDQGVVYLNGSNVARLIGPWRARVARTFGVVSQQCLLVRKRTIGDNLLLAAGAAGLRRKGRQAMKKALGIVGLPNVEGCYPAELSIGECRRVELARALLSSPPVLLLDELTANLDDDSIWDLMHLLNELNNMGTTIIMATHASQYVNIMRRRVLTLVDGRLAGDVKHGKYGDIV